MENCWKVWITENMDKQKKNLIKILKKNGFSDNIIEDEFRKLGISRELKLHDWILNTKADLLKHADPNILITELTNFPSWDNFLSTYYAYHKPVIIRGKLNSDYKKITIDYLMKNNDNCMVEIQKGRTKNENFERNGYSLKNKIGFLDFLNKVQNQNIENDLYMTANNNSNPNNVKVKNNILKEIMNKHVPPWNYLTSDYSESFLWIGGKNTKTPFHHDLTNNLFIQLHGEKEFTMVPYEHRIFIYNNIHVYTDMKDNVYDHEKYLDKFPKLKNLKSVTFRVKAGDILFIPIGWFHKVRSLSNSISLTLCNFKTRNDYYKNYVH